MSITKEIYLKIAVSVSSDSEQIEQHCGKLRRNILLYKSIKCFSPPPFLPKALPKANINSSI